jgi:endonuclease/exonuclease/phosphatase family metal-dependent hydrolase
VALFYRDSPYWQVESIRRYGPNVISFELVTGSRRIPAVGAYVPPADLSTMEFVNRAMEALPQGLRPLLLGDLNVDLDDLRNDRARSMAADLASYGFEDLLPHFRQRCGFCHGTTWWQHRDGGTVRSRCDYILGTDRRMFKNVSLRDPRLFSSDHLMVLGELHSDTL